MTRSTPITPSPDFRALFESAPGFYPVMAPTWWKPLESKHRQGQWTQSCSVEGNDDKTPMHCKSPGPARNDSC